MRGKDHQRCARCGRLHDLKLACPEPRQRERRALDRAEENEKLEFLAEERKAHEQICGVNHRTVDKLRSCEDAYWRRANREYHAANPE